MRHPYHQRRTTFFFADLVEKFFWVIVFWGKWWAFSAEPFEKFFWALKKISIKSLRSVWDLFCEPRIELGGKWAFFCWAVWEIFLRPRKNFSNKSSRSVWGFSDWWWEIFLSPQKNLKQILEISMRWKGELFSAEQVHVKGVGGLVVGGGCKGP